MDKQETISHITILKKRDKPHKLDPTHDENNYGNSTVYRWKNKSVCCN